MSRRRVVIADAGPLIALARIDSLHLLPELFGRVSITTTVRDEILPATAAFPDAELLERTLAEGWMEVVEVPHDDWKLLNPAIDAGAASALAPPATGSMRAMPCCQSRTTVLEGCSLLRGSGVNGGPSPRKSGGMQRFAHSGRNRRFDQQVIVVAHQAPSPHAPLLSRQPRPSSSRKASRSSSLRKIVGGRLRALSRDGSLRESRCEWPGHAGRYCGRHSEARRKT